MSFKLGFEKIAGIGEGLKAAGKETIHEALTLKGMRNAVSDIKNKYKGKMQDLVKTPQGRQHLGEAVAKSLPSAVVGAGYAKGAKMIYNKAKSDNSTQYDQYYQ